MVLGNCLNCEGLVRVPATAQANLQVRCPHCSKSFFLSQILEGSVPELEIVDNRQTEKANTSAEQVATEADDREVFIVPTQLSNGAKRQRSGRSSRSEGSGSKGSGSGSSSSRRRKKRSSDFNSMRKAPSFGRAKPVGQRNSTLEMTKILVGGVLAVPIAYLLVMWGFHQDPLNIGPTVGKSVPFLVPAKLRGDENDDAGEDSNSFDAPDLKSKDDGSLAVPDLDPDKVLKEIGS